MRTSFRLLGASTIVAGVMGLVVACSEDEAPPPVTDKPDTSTPDGNSGAQPITIGVNLSLTGAGAPYGQAEQSGTKVAEQLINSFGGILNRPVKFVIADDTSVTDPSKANVQSFLDQKVPIMLGPTLSAQSAALQTLLKEKRVATISPSASTPGTREAEGPKDRFYFRTAASHSLQAKAIGRKIFNGFSDAPATGMDAGADAADDAEAGTPVDAGAPAACKNPAIIFTDDAYGKPIMNGIKAEIERLGGKVTEVPVPAEAKANYDTEAATVIAAKPDCQVVVSLYKVGINYMRSFKKAVASDNTRDWTKFATIGSNGIFSNAFLVEGRDDQANPDSPTVGEGMYVVNLDLNPDIPQYKEFKNIYLLQFPLPMGKTELEGYTANQFDAAILACLAIQKAGVADDPIKIRDALYDVSRPPGTAFSPARIQEALITLRSGGDVDYDGASGPVDFDDYGEVLGGYVIYRIKQGKFSLLPSDTIKVEDLK